MSEHVSVISVYIANKLSKLKVVYQLLTSEEKK